MKTDERNKFAIKSFLGEYLDLRKDKDNELATVDSIRKGVEFKGGEPVDSYLCHFHGVTWLECELYRRDHRCHVDFSVDGAYHGSRAFCRLE